MKKLILLAMAAPMLSGCFLDDLCGTNGDDDRPQKIYQAPAENPPVVKK